MSEDNTSRGLKKLHPLIARLVPLVLLLAAWNTYLQDIFFTLALPRRKYAKFVFAPRETARKTEENRLKDAS